MPVNRCSCGDYPWFYCPATSNHVCLACLRSPGPLGGPEHPLANGNWCAHRPKNAVGGPATRIYTPAN